MHQNKYTKELSKKFEFGDCKPTLAPMHPTCNSKNIRQAQR